MSNPKRPRDPNQKAKLIVDIATGEVDDVDSDEGKDPAAVALGRKGGRKGEILEIRTSLYLPSPYRIFLLCFR